MKEKKNWPSTIFAMKKKNNSTDGKGNRYDKKNPTKNRGSTDISPVLLHALDSVNPNYNPRFSSSLECEARSTCTHFAHI